MKEDSDKEEAICLIGQIVDDLHEDEKLQALLKTAIGVLEHTESNPYFELHHLINQISLYLMKGHLCLDRSNQARLKELAQIASRDGYHFHFGAGASL